MQELNYTYIDSQKSLEKCVDILSSKESIYIDLEFDKNHFIYGFNLCLMQVATEEKCYLIDPISKLKIETIFPVLENDNIKKVCYAFSEDLRLLHHLGCIPKNVIDLATARILLNYEHISLNRIIEGYRGEKLPKSQQKSNWCKRPLTKEQLKYAAIDVLYLPHLFQQLSTELEENNRWSWMQDEINYLNQVDYKYESHFITVKESEKKEYTKREWLRYLGLLELREELAKKINRPGYKVIDKEIIKLLAKKPSAIKDWPNYKRNIHRKIKNRETKELIQEKLIELEKGFKARNISVDAPAREPLNSMERSKIGKKRAEFNKIKSEYYLPLKEKIREKYGENFANYVLSNRIMIKYFYENLKPLPYQKKIFEELG